ncbi:hypothetical protein [Paraburkholderia sp.]|uniref:hypothetical protein n=1 Tax=Paraburkholderia sp. TaxID=1926495 RepID=UPI0025F56F33|nr:hypothetical protein [Paraburkholderia sp.]
MAENADTASLSPAREARRAPSKRRRASSIPSDSAHQPACEAQQPAQPGEPVRDENTLDLFAGDPAHAPAQTVETGRRRGRSSGGERSRPVRSVDEADEASEVAQAVETLPVAAVEEKVEVSRTIARAEGVAAAEERSPSAVDGGGVPGELAAALKPADGIVDGTVGDERAAEVVAPATDAAQGVAAVESDAAAVANVPEVVPATVEAPVAEPMLPGQALAQAHTARATAAQRPRNGWTAAQAAAADAANATTTTGDTSGSGPMEAAVPGHKPRAETSPVGGRKASETRNAAATIARAAAAAVPAAADTARTARPEPDRARSAASPSTVDALDGLIASQRRASADLSRRMRWMLGTAVGALVVTVAAAIAQTVMLSRVAADARAQQQRLTQMMEEQQAAFAAALARLPAPPAEASSAQAVPQSVARPAAPGPAHRTRRAAAHAHRARLVSQ